MKAFLELSFVLIISVLAKHADSEPLTRSARNGEITLPVEGPQDFTCYDSFGRPHIKDIPHPHDCNLFLKCQERFGGGPVPIQVQCQPGLHFSLTHCRCEHQGQALCFEPEHEHIRMNCACPLIYGPDGYLIPDLSDERCRNGLQ